MRKRYAVALAVAAALLASGGMVYADPFSPADAAGPAPAASAPVVVTLPTGDKVRVTGDGALIPASGDETFEFYAPRLPGGDRIAVPVDVLDDVRSGETDARLFNVDALLRNGYTDARDVTSPGRLGKSFMEGDAGESKAATKVTVTFSWLDGSVPAAAGGIWTNLDTGDFDFFDADKGTATVELPPGDYGFVADMAKADGDDYSDVVGTVADLTVTDEAAELTVDGTKAKPVAFNVDAADAQPQTQSLEFYSHRADDDGIGSTYLLGPKTKLHAIPSEKPKDHKAGLTLRSELASPADAANPYSYSLFSVTEEGIPADPSVTVHDDALAARKANYNSMGAEADMARANLSYHKVYEPTAYQPSASVKVPSQRTEYYTADPDVEWSLLGSFEGANDERVDDVLHHSGAMEPGTQDMPWLSGSALSVGVSDPLFPYYGSGMERWPYADEPELLTRPPMFNTGVEGETITSWGLKGQAVISKDGKELGKSDDGAAVTAQLPEDDKGRYKATFDGEREATWTPLGTRSTATWEFDSAPVTKDTVLDLSAVRFTAAGIEGGYASADKPQDVELDFTTQPGAEDRTCADMTFRVSYDDGKTWQDVTIERDGDHATATLEHPDGATFVSVKFTAEDDKGQTVEHSTIRSYGLK
ncbi:hypothetical protein [Stackebrandtia nassauensis]|uniref:Peptidase S8 and S53 subtilisin kexin sedolisin n=1 Tax=Stackebrandtia nassauensis (strain DSM 44728 / CIP 108903 / NRRL B-16338 / NBRC 102104 / LLR-40K-21) TaxID=446470 RepID=D3PVR4_STANL|nr:hypothetical protein [Stackebrandtia nassauensis]ADD43178.1 hypothetical protein Snas_3515 [Stackebrandtia nassauensis DSM 44728]